MKAMINKKLSMIDFLAIIDSKFIINKKSIVALNTYGNTFLESQTFTNAVTLYYTGTLSTNIVFQANIAADTFCQFTISNNGNFV
jgi:hypothetical protein